MTKYFGVKLNKILSVFLMCMTAAALLSGCKLEIQNNLSGRLKIVTVSYAQYDFAGAVCGGLAEVTMLSKPGGDVHGYEPSLRDIKKIAEADVFVYNGGESDEWVEGILDSINNPSLKTVKLSQYVELLCSEHDHEHAEDEHGEEGHFDEHIQSSPKNAVLMVKAICEAVCEKDEANAEYYEKYAGLYINEINRLDAELEQISSNAQNTMLIVADRFPFVYFVEHYGFEYKALFAGCSQENDANPSVMTDMIETVRQNNITAVFYTELSDGKMADTLCDETGVKKLMLHSCEGISEADFESGIRYVDLMEKNIINLKEALS